MRIFAALMLAASTCLFWQSGVIEWTASLWRDATAPLAHMPALEERVTGSVQTQRLTLESPMLQSDPALQKWMLELLKSGVTDPDVLAQSVRRAWPQYQDVSVMQSYSLFEDGVLDCVDRWKEASTRELTHLAVVVRPGAFGIGSRVTMVAGQRLPDLTPAALANGKQSLFYSVCTLCGKGQPCQVPQPARVFKLRCQHCQELYAMLAADSTGRFHFVNEFLDRPPPPGPFPPDEPKLAVLMHLWCAQMSRCRYVPDRGDENDVWQTAEETLALRQGDCEDGAILLADWLLSSGFQVRIAIGEYDGQEGAHAWVVARIAGEDYLLEPTEYPFNLQRPPYLSEVSSRYVPELLFDREAIFTPRKPGAQLRQDYWSDGAWKRVVTKQ
jgi:hypothetical protein